jgi:nitrite reductase (NADH) small subunit
MERHAVCSTDALPEPGTRYSTEVEGIEVTVFRLSDGYFALENKCAHQGGPVCRGATFRKLTAEVMPDGRTREFYASEEEDVIACPLHGWEFDIRSGRALADARRGVRKFAVDVDGGDVYVTVPQRKESLA